MRVVDTSAWIEWICGSAVRENVGRELPENNEWVVPTIVQYELARWLTSEAATVSAIAFSAQLIVEPLDTELATKAVDYANRHGLAMADSIIYATAMDSDADLLTCDARFVELPRVRYLPKAMP
jgi:uncharacterized protein